MSITFTDIFCGAGGSSTGLVNAGFELKLAANHWQRAIETHSANHPDAEHLCADVNNYDFRRLPRTDLLWASPICTEISPAGGRRRTKGQLSLLDEGPIANEAWERTRATAYDVIRATEVHRYKAVLCENVVEFVTDWELFDWWRNGMELLGYNSQIVSMSTAHIGGDGIDYAPQWRDRIYIVFTRKDIRQPDLALRPWAWCHECGDNVRSVQAWRNGRRVGKYGQQYDYRCPNTSCRHALVEPYTRPAADIIDWSDVGKRIGDRAKPLAAATIRRIEAGLRKFPDLRSVITVNHGVHDGRAYPADARPLATRTIKIGDGLLVPAGGTWNDTATSLADPMRTRLVRDNEAVVTEPFVVEFRRNADASPIHDPLATVTAQGGHHGVVVPDGAFYVKNYGGNFDPKYAAKPVTSPLGTVTVRDSHSLVIPYRNAAPKTTREPLLTLATKDSAAIVQPAVSVDDCFFRMVQPSEQFGAQGFPTSYIRMGNKGEQTMQAGNAVSVNAAQWIAMRMAPVLDGSAA